MAVMVLVCAGLGRLGLATGVQRSVCYGSTGQGRLKDGVKLPFKGDNFQAYAYLPWQLGRTYVHSSVSEVVLGAYEALHGVFPQKRFVYGETGWAAGGPFKPHKTHQNGLSVDFIVPVVNEKGRSVPLGCGAMNKYCYAIEFDEQGQNKHHRIDFEALSEHLYWLHKKAHEEKAFLALI